MRFELICKSVFHKKRWLATCILMSLATTVGAVELAEKGFLEPDLTLTSDNPELKKSRDKEFLG